MTFIAPHYLEFFHARREEAGVLVVTFLVVIIVLAMLTEPGRRLLHRAFRRVTKAKLRFTTRERSTVWFGTMEDGRYLVSLKGIWNVANASRRAVILKQFYVRGLLTEHHILSADCGDVRTIKKVRFVNIKQTIASANSLVDSGPYSEAALSPTSR
jgi:hypothetical protein